MFTGIVEKLASVLSFKGKTFCATNPFSTEDLTIGQSIAVSGCCLTVVDFDSKSISFEVSPETLSKTKFRDISSGASVNLERGVKVGGSLDGHWVTGHIDSVGFVTQVDPLKDGMKQMVIQFPQKFGRWLVDKGSIAVDGVSLTVNETENDRFSIVLIPHTLAVTSLRSLKNGDAVNLEFDLFAKYVEKMIGRGDFKQAEA
jgi:riboflavin synthase